MNNYSLDDLIIENTKPANSRTKSFLTIIGLLIIVLIIAIILTKIILKDPSAEQLIVEENNTEIISPELTLQDVIKPTLTEEKSKLSNIIDESPSAPIQVKEVSKETISITEKVIQPKKQAEVRTIEKEVTNKPSKVKPVTSKSYYIQVGSFTKIPSPRFLNIIKKSGFNYKITSSTNSGVKKLLIGPYKDRSSAKEALPKIKDRINKSAFVISK